MSHALQQFMHQMSALNDALRRAKFDVARLDAGVGEAQQRLSQAQQQVYEYCTVRNQAAQRMHAIEQEITDLTNKFTAATGPSRMPVGLPATAQAPVGIPNAPQPPIGYPNTTQAQIGLPNITRAPTGIPNASHALTGLPNSAQAVLPPNGPRQAKAMGTVQYPNTTVMANLLSPANKLPKPRLQTRDTALVQMALAQNSHAILPSNHTPAKAPVSKPANADDTTLQRLNDFYPTVVKVKGMWMEIRCRYCSANAYGSPDTFFTGLHGVLRHVRLAHKVPDAEGLAHCTARSVSMRDIALMSGAPPMDAKDSRIEMCLGSPDCKSCSKHSAGNQSTPILPALPPISNFAPTIAIPQRNFSSLAGSHETPIIKLPVSESQNHATADDLIVVGSKKKPAPSFTFPSQAASPVQPASIRDTSALSPESNRSTSDVFEQSTRLNDKAFQTPQQPSLRSSSLTEVDNFRTVRKDSVYDEFKAIEKNAKNLRVRLKPRAKRQKYTESPNSHSSRGDDEYHDDDDNDDDDDDEVEDEDGDDSSDDVPLSQLRKRKH